MATKTTTTNAVIPPYNLTNFKKFTTAGTDGATSSSLAIQTAVSGAKPAQTILGGDASGLLGGKSSAGTVKTPAALLSDLLPKSAFTDTFQAKDSAFAALQETSAWLGLEATKNSTKTALVLAAESAVNGTAKMLVNVATDGKAPYSGNGKVAEIVNFYDLQGNRLTMVSTLESVNVTGSKTKLGFAGDALNQTREVTFTGKGIASNYKFVTKHNFAETPEGNQALIDSTHKIYSYSDANLKITSNSTTAISQSYFDANGVAVSKSQANASYSYDNNSPVSGVPYSSHLDYNGSQTINYSKSPIGFVTLTTTMQVSKFTFKDGATEINAKGTVVTSTGKSDVFTTPELSVKNGDYSLVVKKFVSGDFLNDLVGTLLNNNNTVFNESFASAKADQSATIKSKFFGDGFKGTTHSESIAILKADGGKVDGLAGDDTIIGGAGSDMMTGNSGNDVITGGAGDDQFLFSPLVTSDLDTTAGVVTDTITDFKIRGLGSVEADLKNTMSGFGEAATAQNYFEATDAAKNLAALLIDADSKLDGTIKYYVGQVGKNGYLVTDNDGMGYTDVIQLTGTRLSDIAFADILA